MDDEDFLDRGGLFRCPRERTSEPESDLFGMAGRPFALSRIFPISFLQLPDHHVDHSPQLPELIWDRTDIFS